MRDKVLGVCEVFVFNICIGIVFVKLVDKYIVGIGEVGEVMYCLLCCYNVILNGEDVLFIEWLYFV